MGANFGLLVITNYFKALFPLLEFADLVDQHAGPPAGPSVNREAAGFGNPIETRAARRTGMQLWWVQQCQWGCCWLWQPH